MVSDDTRACRLLWAAVLLAQWDAAFWVEPAKGAVTRASEKSRQALRNERRMAMDWFGTRSFRTVCALAGVADDWIFEGFQRRVAELQVAA